MTRTFDTSTLEGLKAAERFKSRMNNQFDHVEVRSIGLNRVQITGYDASEPRGYHQNYHYMREFYGAALTDNNGRSTEKE